MGASTAAQLITVTPVLDTAIYASGDLLFDKIEVPNAVFAKGRCAELLSVSVLDKGDQAVAFDLLFFDNSTTLGTFNAAFAASDALMADCQYHKRIAAADHLDVGGSRIVHYDNIRHLLEAASTSRSFWIAGITQGGTPTYAASDLVIKLGFIWH